MKRLFFLIPFAVIAATVSATASPLYYWDFNGGTIENSIGASTETHATWSGSGLDIIIFTPGTMDNAVSGYDAGDALTWVDIVNVYSSASFVIKEMEFNGISNVQLSFAVDSTKIFAAMDSLDIYYDTGSGFVFKESRTLQSESGWYVETVNLPELNNATYAGVAIVANAVFNLGDVFRLDNVKIGIIPEPTTWAGLLLALPIAFLGIRRKICA